MRNVLSRGGLVPGQLTYLWLWITFAVRCVVEYGIYLAADFFYARRQRRLRSDENVIFLYLAAISFALSIVFWYIVGHFWGPPYALWFLSVATLLVSQRFVIRNLFRKVFYRSHNKPTSSRYRVAPSIGSRNQLEVPDEPSRLHGASAAHHVWSPRLEDRRETVVHDENTPITTTRVRHSAAHEFPHIAASYTSSPLARPPITHSPYSESPLAEDRRELESPRAWLDPPLRSTSQKTSTPMEWLKRNPRN